MPQEAIDLLLAIVEYLLYPHHLASADNDKIRKLVFCSEAFEKSIK